LKNISLQIGFHIDFVSQMGLNFSYGIENFWQFILEERSQKAVLKKNEVLKKLRI
jgi:hypothetical protein